MHGENAAVDVEYVANKRQELGCADVRLFTDDENHKKINPICTKEKFLPSANLPCVLAASPWNYRNPFEDLVGYRKVVRTLVTSLVLASHMKYKQ